MLNKIQKWLQIDLTYLSRSGFWLVLGTGLEIVITLCTAVAFANLLPQTQYGIYKYILSIIALTAALNLTGFGTTIIKAVAKGFEGTFLFGVKKFLLQSIVPATVTTVIALYYLWKDDMVLGIGILIAGLLAPLLRTAVLYKPFLQGKKDFQSIVTYQPIHSIIPAFCVIGALFLTNDVIIILITYFVSNLLMNCVIFVHVLYKYRPNTLVENTAYAFSKHLTVMNLLTSTAGQLDKLLVFQLLGSHMLAVYSIAYAFPQQLSNFQKAIRTLVFPKISSRTMTEIRKTIIFRSSLLFLFGTVMASTYTLLAPLFITTLFPLYTESILYSQLLAWTMPFICIVPYNLAFNAHECTRILYYIKIIVPVCFISTLFILAIPFGILGVIAAVLLRQLYSFIAHIYFFHFSSLLHKNDLLRQ